MLTFELTVDVKTYPDTDREQVQEYLLDALFGAGLGVEHVAVNKVTEQL